MAVQQLRMTIQGKVYTVPGFDEVTIRDILVFDREADELGIAEEWADVEDIAMRAADKDGPGVAVRQYRVLILASVWLAKRFAGEPITLDEAAEVKPSEATFVMPPKDRKPSKKAAAKSTQTSSRPA